MSGVRSVERLATLLSSFAVTMLPLAALAQPLAPPVDPAKTVAATGADLEPTGDAKAKQAAGIVARVDEQAILLEDVLNPIRAQLNQAREQLPPAQYRQFEREKLRQVTEAKIQRLVVIKELALKMDKPEKMEMIREAVKSDFDKYLLQLARSAGLKTREEIVARLEKEGSSLLDLQREFTDNMLAQHYLGQLLKGQVKEPTRDDMVRYYQDHIDDYRDEVGATWRQIQVSYKSDKAAAQQKIVAIQQKLAAGEDFAKVAEKESDGPTAVNGGLWSLTSKGSYADDAVDKVIFSVPVGEISQVVEGASAYHLVRVEKRSNGDHKPFSEVQDIVRDKIQNERTAGLRQAKIEELMKQHYIESVFDDPQPGEEKQATGKSAKALR